MKRLRAAVVGLGVGERHIAGYRSHPSCEVVALCDFAAEKREMARRRYPELRVATRDEEILTDPEIDVVSIATFDDHHARQVVQAIEHGKHVFVEKPLCLHEEELAAIRRALSEHPEVRLSSNLILRRSPRFRLLREMTRRGELGELFYLEADYNYGRLHKIVSGWRGELDFYSVVHGGAIHLVDLLMWLTGERIVEVTARGNRIAAAGSRFRNHDLVVAIGRLEGGALAKIAANFGCVHPHFHVLNLYGTEATFLNDWPAAKLWRTRDRDAGPELVDAAYPGAEKGDLIHSFVESIVSGSQAEVSAAEVFDAMAVSLAIERASHQPGPVEVRYP